MLIQMFGTLKRVVLLHSLFPWIGFAQHYKKAFCSSNICFTVLTASFTSGPCSPIQPNNFSGILYRHLDKQRSVVRSCRCLPLLPPPWISETFRATSCKTMSSCHNYIQPYSRQGGRSSQEDRNMLLLPY